MQCAGAAAGAAPLACRHCAACLGWCMPWCLPPPHPPTDAQVTPAKSRSKRCGTHPGVGGWIVVKMVLHPPHIHALQAGVETQGLRHAGMQGSARADTFCKCSTHHPAGKNGPVRPATRLYRLSSGRPAAASSMLHGAHRWTVRAAWNGRHAMRWARGVRDAPITGGRHCTCKHLL